MRPGMAIHWSWHESWMAIHEVLTKEIIDETLSLCSLKKFSFSLPAEGSFDFQKLENRTRTLMTNVNPPPPHPKKTSERDDIIDFKPIQAPRVMIIFSSIVQISYSI